MYYFLMVDNDKVHWHIIQPQIMITKMNSLFILGVVKTVEV